MDVAYYFINHFFFPIEYYVTVTIEYYFTFVCSWVMVVVPLFYTWVMGVVLLFYTWVMGVSKKCYGKPNNPPDILKRIIQNIKFNKLSFYATTVNLHRGFKLMLLSEIIFVAYYTKTHIKEIHTPLEISYPRTANPYSYSVPKRTTNQITLVQALG